MGCSSAYYLLKIDPNLKVAVIEPDPTYKYASTPLSLSNFRIQFDLKENIQISKYAFEVLENFAEEMEVNGVQPDVGFRREGNLFIHNESGKNLAIRGVKLQKCLDCSVDWIDANTIAEKYPLFDMSKYSGGTFGYADGYIDAYSMLMGYRKKAGSMGVKFITGKVSNILTNKNTVTSISLDNGDILNSNIILNCAGAWAAPIAKTAEVDIPVKPYTRQVYIFETEKKPDGPLPLTILPSGFYLRTETGGLILAGKSLKEDAIGYDLTWNRQRFFDLIWPELAEFIPAFEKLKLIRGWAGYYAVNTLDGNAILGEWPELNGFYLANGFSGHGLQQGPAVGRYLAELITENKLSLDLSIFSPQRILDNNPIEEGALV